MIKGKKNKEENGSFFFEGLSNATGTLSVSDAVRLSALGMGVSIGGVGFAGVLLRGFLTGTTSLSSLSSLSSSSSSFSWSSSLRTSSNILTTLKSLITPLEVAQPPISHCCCKEPGAFVKLIPTFSFAVRSVMLENPFEYLPLG